MVLEQSIVLVFPWLAGSEVVPWEYQPAGSDVLAGLENTHLEVCGGTGPPPHVRE